MNIGTVTVTMNNWIVESDHSILLGISGENAVARLDIITTVDAGWIYMLEIEHLERGEKNIIPLTAETNKVYAILTSEMLGNRGGKKLQIRAINGEQVKKSNVFRGYVDDSVNASENIPEHAQTVIDEAVERVDELATNAGNSAAAAETSATNAQSSAAAAERAAQEAANIEAYLGITTDVIALKEDLGNLADNKKKVKVEQTIIHTVKSGATYYALDKMIPANTEVFWSVSTEGSVNNTSLTFNNEQNESKRIWVEPNTSGSLTFDDTLSFFEVWSASTQDGQVTISFYWYCYNQVFASVDAVLELSNRVDSVDVKVEDDEYNINNLQISVFGSKKNMSLIPYLENEDGKYYNAKGEIAVNGGWYCNIYKIKDVENISIYNWAGGNLPLCCFFDTNGSFIEGSSFTPSEGWTGLYLSVEKPENAFYIGVNATDTRNKIRVNGYVFEDSYKVREEIERMESIISSTSELSYDVKNLQNQLAKTQRMNDFAYSEFDKAYFVLTIDDGNMYLPVVYDLCHELGIPLCPAIIPSNLNTSFDGRTVRDICNLVVADGGEILSHSGKYITNDSTEQDYIDVFRETKKTLENEGFNIRGIITAGGTGYSSFTKKLDDWSRKYYDYSDQNGLKTSIAYSHSRWWHHDYTMAQCKTYVDNAVANKSFVVMAMHGTNDTEDLEYVDHVRELLEYMIAKGSDNLVFTTWAYVYDTFGSTVLEERIKALEK